MSSAVNLMIAVDVRSQVGAIRRNRAEISVARFVPSLVDQVTDLSVWSFDCARRGIVFEWLLKYLR